MLPRADRRIAVINPTRRVDLDKEILKWNGIGKFGNLLQILAL